VGILLDKSNVLIVIPARYESSRLPGKILEDLHGFPMIYWVYRRAKIANSGEVIVAADHPRTYKKLEDLGIPYIQTNQDCKNGTERIYEVSKKYPYIKYFINVQADEPLLNPDIIEQMLACSLNGVFNTAVSQIQGNTNNQNEIKVALSFGNRIRYASRSPVPYCANELYKIHGVYLYSRDILKAFVNAPLGPLEQLESIEQLRCLENDIPLYGVKTFHTERSVDTFEDLLFMRNQPRELFF
jgi:3-deoxy-manno-octulosonate cytidylyltransferase (CMP-KDO synthetase)